MYTSRFQLILVHVLVGLLLSACATSEPSPSPNATQTKKVTIATPPAASRSAAIPPKPKLKPTRSAVLGLVIKHRNRGSAALIAAVGGGIASTNIDSYMEQQAEELQERLESEVQREEITIVMRPRDNAVLIRMTSPTNFDNLSSVIKPRYLVTLNKIAPVLNQYNKTMLTVIGYTENVGPDSGNKRLAIRRAQSVVNYFTTQKVNLVRLQSYALSGTQARAGINTEAGRTASRRVELWVQPVMAK